MPQKLLVGLLDGFVGVVAVLLWRHRERERERTHLQWPVFSLRVCLHQQISPTRAGQAPGGTQPGSPQSPNERKERKKALNVRILIIGIREREPALWK